ncbi:nuclease domain-containing protein [Neobacillus sp. Marseille-QA0830]
MKLYQMYVKEKIPSNPFFNFLFEEQEIEVGEPLAYQNEFFIMNEYSRGVKGRLMRIGVYAPHAVKVVIISDGMTSELVESITRPGYWYEQASGWFENGYLQNTESCFGMNACGQWKVRVLGNDGETLEEEKVIVIPRTMSYMQYQTMQAEVKNLFENLSKNLNEGSFLKEVQISLFPLEPLLTLIEEMKIWLKQICAQPAERLTRIRNKTIRSQITKWDRDTFIEASLFPFRNSLSAPVSQKETSIDEHRMIRFMLEHMGERALQERLVETSALQHLQTELAARLESQKKMGASLRKHSEKRCQSIENDIEIIAQRKDKWQKCQEIIQEFLDEPLFTTEPLEVDLTHLFIHDPIYGVVYDLYEQFEEMTPKLESQEKQFIDSVMNSPRLYEIWVLLQLIHQLGKLKVPVSGVRKSLMEKFINDQTISGWVYRFPYDHERGEMFLYYDRELQVRDVGTFKPDYLLFYRKNKSDKWQGHSLDAKYKPYTEMPHNKLQMDMEHSGRRYLDRITGANLTMKSSALVHVDMNATNWNVSNNGIYKLSHFSIVPGALENLQIYIKRIFHYFGHQHQICPSCGESVKMIDGGFKQTYICPHDDEVWVSNICRYRRSHGAGYIDRSLMKYSSGNYNTQVRDEWDVYCPVCKRDVNGNILNLDLYGH